MILFCDSIVCLFVFVLCVVFCFLFVCFLIAVGRRTITGDRILAENPQQNPMIRLIVIDGSSTTNGDRRIDSSVARSTGAYEAERRRCTDARRRRGERRATGAIDDIAAARHPGSLLGCRHRSVLTSSLCFVVTKG
jgi:hypothetical protein